MKAFFTSLFGMADFLKSEVAPSKSPEAAGTSVAKPPIEKIRVEKIDPQMEVARLIAEAFRTGEVSRKYLPQDGISTVEVLWNEKRVSAEWYSSGRLSDLRISGSGSASFNARATDIILTAAKERAKDLFKLEMQKLCLSLPSPNSDGSADIDEMEVARSISAEIQNGYIHNPSLQGAVTSEMSVNWQGRRVTISWSPLRDPRVEIRGADVRFCAKAKSLIVSNAKDRGHRLLDEELHRVAEKPLEGDREERAKSAAFISHEICQKIQEGDLWSHSIDPEGISQVSLVWRREHIGVSWFSSGDLYEVNVGGKSLYSDGLAAGLLLKNAKDRASRIHDEEMSNLYRNSM